MITFKEKAERAIPADLLNELVEQVKKGKQDLKNSLAINGDRMVFFFEVYNRYLAGTKKEKIDCKGCRTRVWGKLEMLANEIESERAAGG